VDYDVAIIGCGRVGLPLALAFADHGLKVIGVDNAADRLAAVRAGRMPFSEPGAQEILDRVDVLWTDDVTEAARARTSSSRSARRRSPTSRST
jgi:UDP-N-acetyl-D-mannosaminuronic acid dehydrogenase